MGISRLIILIHKILFLLLFSLIVTTESYSQSLHIRKTSETIEIDGQLLEQSWEIADKATGFWQYFPADTSLADDQTEVMVTFDDHFIYVAAKMYRAGTQDYITPSLRRDYRGSAYDGFTVVLDTYSDRTNAFSFGVNPYGVQREGLVSSGGSGGGGPGRGGGGFSLDWDNKWFSEARRYEGYWIAEMAIPLKTIRYKKGENTWLANFYRIDSKTGERSSWAHIPVNFSLTSLAFSKEIQWEEPLVNPGKNISLIPYAAFQTLKNFEEQTDVENQVTVGGDAKIAVTPALNLDLTFNPDFSQVEVDQQVTNLDRFEIFFPERRQFFLENADLFGDFGSFSARPFFSRRIGIAQDSSTGQNIQNPLYAGARLSGKIDNNWRIGLMSIQAARDKDIALPSTNYTVASVQRKVWERSNIGVIFVNKQAFQDSVDGDFTVSPLNYNRTLGFDFNLASADNIWNGKIFYHRSFDNYKLDSAFSSGAEMSYSTYRWDARTRIFNIGANFNPEVGFVRRTDYLQWAGTVYYNLYPKRGIIQSHAPGFDYDMLGNSTYGFMDWDVNLMYRINFRNTSRFSMRLRRQYTYLFDSFDPSGTDGPELPANSEYAYNMIFANYDSDFRKDFGFEVSTRSGQYFNGYRVNLEGRMSYRFQPYGVISLDFEYNGIRLPDPYNDSDLYLVGPRLDLTFTRSLFWTTLIQYNSQINNVNVNSRFQWRFKPVSDLYLVYTDNYLAGVDGTLIDFNQPKYRAFVIKLTYWLNL